MRLRSFLVRTDDTWCLSIRTLRVKIDTYLLHLLVNVNFVFFLYRGVLVHA